MTYNKKEKNYNKCIYIHKKSMDINAIVLIIILIIALILRVTITYNTIISIKNNVKESSSAIDVFLKNRFDLIPNIVAAVKWYAKHETENLEKLTKIRSEIWHDNHKKERFQVENGLSHALKSVFAVAENYPDLKASKNFLILQQQLETLEDKIQAARRWYNAAVKELQDKKEQFPSNIIANNMDIDPYDMFNATDEEKEVVDINI